MGAILGWGALIVVSSLAPSLVEKYWPSKTDQTQPSLTDQLFRLSLILGIAVSGFTLYTYLKK